MNPWNKQMPKLNAWLKRMSPDLPPWWRKRLAGSKRLNPKSWHLN